MFVSRFPLITIGLTCYQAADTIRDAINSAAQQDWPNFEILVVDDSSTDGSINIIEKEAERLKNVQFIRMSHNTGVASTRNTILENARGEFLVFFDDDDVSKKNRVRLQYEKLITYESICDTSLIACYASGLRVYPNGYKFEINAIGSRAVVPTGEIVADYLLFNRREAGIFYGAGTPACSLMARTSTFKTVGGFDIEFRRVEDIDFAIRLALLGGHFIGCHESVFTQKATVAPDKTPKKNLESELKLIDKYANYLKSKERLSYAHNWMYIRYYHFSGQRLRFIYYLIRFIVKFPLPAIKHILNSAPKRLSHEYKIIKK